MQKYFIHVPLNSFKFTDAVFNPERGRQYLQKKASIIPENKIQLLPGVISRICLSAVTSCARTELSRGFHNHGHLIRARKDASTRGWPVCKDNVTRFAGHSLHAACCAAPVQN